MRADGRRIRTLQPLYILASHIMAERSDAMNMIELDIPLAPIHDYMNETKAQGHHFSHLGIIIAAYVRTISQHPLLNRFVVNKRVFARNEIAIGMVVLKPGKDEGTMNKMYFKPTDTIFDIQNKLDEYINNNRAEGDTNATDDLINKLLAIPGLARFAVNLIKFMDKLDLLPKSIIDASPMHCTMTITNLASIRTNYIYHHIYNFGTTSMLTAMGNLREVPVRRHGQIEFERCIPLGVVMDERIADGCQFANAFKDMQKYLKNPKLLEVPPERVVEDIP
ncbi:MAG: 2-oxo acid dehydrogenase subunit E2 [Oscillospiraceae bacterium]|nr:2-oxo acid dehydrogenase subunit E2 [Oscillospiraceae bacterium]